MQKSFALILAIALAAALTGSGSASAGCTAAVSCNNGCMEDIICPRPFPPCELFCSVSASTASCTGNTTCTVGSGFVTCDGNKVSCPARPQCFAGSTTISCGNQTKVCHQGCPV